MDPGLQAAPGGLLHRQEDNSTVNGSAKTCATTEAELDDYVKGEGGVLQREREGSDRVERESRQAIQGGPIESNRRRH
jgi:hypothetical protein